MINEEFIKGYLNNIKKLEQEAEMNYQQLAYEIKDPLLQEEVSRLYDRASTCSDIIGEVQKLLKKTNQ